MVSQLLSVAADNGYDSKRERVSAVASVLIALSKKHVNRCDESVQAFVASAAPTSKKSLQAFLQHTFSQVANSAHFIPADVDAKTSLALALDHPTESTRFQAIQSLEKQHAESTSSGGASVLSSPSILLRRLQDDSARIVQAVVSTPVGDLLLQLASKKKVFDTTVQVVQRWAGRRDATGIAVVQALLQFLVEKFRVAFDSAFDEKILLLALTLLPARQSASALSKKKRVSVSEVWGWIAALDHSFGAALRAASSAEHTVPSLTSSFGAALADKDFSSLLPFCLSWTKSSEINQRPLTPLLIPVLRHARQELRHKKSKSKAHKEHTRAIDNALRFVLKKEFRRMCTSTDEADLKDAVSVAQSLGEIAADMHEGEHTRSITDEFDQCISILLQAPVTVFMEIQMVVAQVFQQNEALESELLPTMCRILLSSSYDSADDNSNLLLTLAKTRALDIISVVLKSGENEDAENAIPFVIVALGDEKVNVREAAITCLARFLEDADDTDVSEEVKTLVAVASRIVKAKSDMLMDSRAIGVFFGTLQTEDDLVVDAFANLVIRNVMNSPSHRLSVKLLELLNDIEDCRLWVKTTVFVQGLLETLAGNTDTDSKSSASVIKLLLGHYLKNGVSDEKALAAFFDVLMTVLQQDTASLEVLADVQAFALAGLTEAFFIAIDAQSKALLVTRLLKMLIVSKDAVASQLIRTLNDLPISAAMFVDLLRDELERNGGHNVSTSATKTRTRDVSDAKEQEFLQGLSCVLEVLAVKIDDVAMDADADTLLTTLSDVLELLCHPDHAERVSEYLLQVVFGCLRRLCEVHAITKPAVEVSNGKKTKNGSKSKSSKHDGVEPGTLVKHTLACLARTASPQTRNEALLFISALVNVYPVSVLSSLEKILSFVGAGAMHQDDDYSFNVLETIIKSVVPHIVNEAAAGAASDIVTVQQFIHIFVEAYEQIPSKRRLLLFQVVVQSLGDRFLPYVIVALLESGVLSTAAALEDRTRFAHQLSIGFGAVAQIAGLVTQLRLVRGLHSHVVDNSGAAATNDVEEDEDDDDESSLGEMQPFCWNKATIASRDAARQLNVAIVRFIPQHLQSRELHHLILQLEDEEDDEDMIDEEDNEDVPASTKLQEHYLVLAQIVLLYFRRLTREQSTSDDETADVDPRGFWAELAQETIEILGALQQLLSTPGFVAVIGELLHHDNSLVRKRAMQLFNERLQDDRDTLTPGEELLFVDMVDELNSILLNEGGSENTVNIQTALLSVDILARSFAVKHPKKFQSILPTVIKYVNVDLKTQKDGKATNVSTMALHLMGCAFVSLASICRAIGPVVFPFLPKFFPTLLEAISFCSSKTGRKRAEDSSAVGGVSTVLQCLLSSLEVFTDHIPQFLTPYLSQIVKVLLLSSLVPSGVNVSAQPLPLTVDSCFVNITNHVELRHLLPNLFGAYDTALAQGDRSIVRLLAVISTVVTSLQTADLRQYLPIFARFFVTSLDLRRVHSAKLHDLDVVEDEVLDVLVQFILRLNEKQLKPLFLKVFEWSQHMKSPRGAADRNIVFFKLLVKLSDRLKSIFVPYYAHVLEALASALRGSRDALIQKKYQQNGVGSDDDDDDDFFARDDEDVTPKAGSKKRKLLNGGAEASTEVAVPKEVYYLQLQVAVRALNGCFVYDSDGFIDKDHFEVVMSPLVDSLDIVKTMPEAKPFVFESVSECIANLAWAAKNDLLWKPLHYAVLMKSRGDSAAVRLATLKVVEKCYTVIGDEFLAMLPESIPFLAELMEDNDAEVERTCHRVIKQIEEISGESLDQYLTS
ncbi:hypothetical protein PINS_up009579 [Pythium insidiosum]|nr:hypothetical protein PINS_up009579 [Pythium insidiosum]